MSFIDVEAELPPPPPEFDVTDDYDEPKVDGTVLNILSGGDDGWLEIPGAITTTAATMQRRIPERGQHGNHYVSVAPSKQLTTVEATPSSVVNVSVPEMTTSVAIETPKTTVHEDKAEGHGVTNDLETVTVWDWEE